MKLAAIQIRGIRGMRQDVKDTLFMLRLRKKNACVILPDTPVFRGMLSKAKDFITYGTIDDSFAAELEKSKLKQLAHDDLKVFFLHPPRGGFERKGIKVPFQSGGALGDRGGKVDEVIKKMM